jgi:hypothetical protein
MNGPSANWKKWVFEKPNKWPKQQPLHGAAVLFFQLVAQATAKASPVVTPRACGI